MSYFKYSNRFFSSPAVTYKSLFVSVASKWHMICFKSYGLLDVIILDSSRLSLPSAVKKKANVLIITYTDKKIKERDKEPMKDGRKDKLWAFQFRPQRPVIIYLSLGGERGGGFWRGNQMVFMGNGGGLDYTLIQSIRGGLLKIDYQLPAHEGRGELS